MSTSAFDANAFLQIAPENPGVYRMLSSNDEILYVGKAKNLKKRLSSYFQKNVASAKTRALVKLISRIELDVTHTEVEALLLEHNYIKTNKPRFNVLLRDDKSYPYIYLSSDKYPRLTIHRGAKKSKGQYFGPFPSAAAVRETLRLLQKLFQLRQCENSYFNNRTRPCLQYQIKRCKAPCMEYLSEKDYAVDVETSRLLLEGKNQSTLDFLISSMDTAASNQDYEQAAFRRDQISYIRQIITQQSVESGNGNLDVLAIAVKSNLAIVQIMFIRGGRVIGTRNFFPRINQHTKEEILSAFISQFYVNSKDIPAEIICTEILEDADLLQQLLSQQSATKVVFKNKVREQRLRWLKLTQKNVDQALALKIAGATHQQQRLMKLVDLLDLKQIPKRMECFDISHTSGINTVASCVVFGQEGPITNQYRRFNITGITGGDDYAAMEQALTRRFKKIKEGIGDAPDILFVDGGKGQLKQAIEVLDKLDITDIMLIGVAKGSDRRAGTERLFFADRPQPLIVDEHNPALHLIQHIRDESHRFAISGHRNKRSKQHTRSPLEEINGIGPKRRQSLLKQFGGLQQLKKAAIGDIAKVPGFNHDLAKKIYDFFQE
jgi:excinuclease ABC subunit C